MDNKHEAFLEQSPDSSQHNPIPNTSNQQNHNLEERSRRSIPCCGFFSVEYYQQFFDTTTDEVLKKIYYALTVVSYQRFKNLTKGRIDFYGPFWIYATIVFSLAVSQNLYSYLTRPEESHFRYTIGYAPNAFMIVYVFGVFVPVFFNVILRAFGGVIEYFKVISIYGYSQCINVIMLLLCAYPSHTAQNFFIIWGAIQSSAFQFLCLNNELENYKGNLRFIAVCTMAGCQIVLIIIYKTYFFGDLYSDNFNPGSFTD